MSASLASRPAAFSQNSLNSWVGSGQRKGSSRVEAGALLYTSAPFGLFLATWVNVEVAGDWFQHDPANSWRYVLMFGLLPAAVAFVVRMFVKEPEKWARAAASAAPARLREIFAPELRPRTISALIVAIIALIAWWSCNAFIPVVATTMAQSAAAERALDVLATTALVEDWKFKATMAFNIGGLVGTLLDCHSNWAAIHHLMARDGLDKAPCTVTADFHVKLKRPTPIGQPLRLRAHVVESSEDRALVEASIEAGDKVTATCRGTFVAVQPGHPAYNRW